jgi:RND family efflux transporter MFP subunit
MMITSGCSRDNSPPPEERPVAVRAVRPVRTDLQRRLAYVGTVRGRSEIQIIAQVQGTVVSLPKPEGAPVSPGDLVAELAAPELVATVDRLRAEKDYWCERHEENLRLVQNGALPQEEADASLRACRSARAGLEEAQSRLEKTRELASIEGRVLSWIVEPGQHVMPGQPLLIIAGKSLEIQVKVVEEDLRRGVVTGLPVIAQTRQGTLFEARVREVAPMASGPARTFTVKIPVPGDQSTHLRIGSSMQVELILDSCAGCVAVPKEAIMEGDGTSYVFLVRDGRAFQREVTTGIEDRGLVQVFMPLTDNDRVAVSNVAALSDSIPVFAVEVVEGSGP